MTSTLLSHSAASNPILMYVSLSATWSLHSRPMWNLISVRSTASPIEFTKESSSADR